MGVCFSSSFLNTVQSQRVNIRTKPHLLALRFEVKADVHLLFSLIEIDQTECLLMILGW
jgi:hypothetical protein